LPNDNKIIVRQLKYLVKLCANHQSIICLGVKRRNLRYFTDSLPLREKTASAIFDRLFRQKGQICTLLESPSSNENECNFLARYSICAGVPASIEGKLQIWTPSIGKILPCLQNLLANPPSASDLPSELPFTGGWLGWLGYDLAWEIERLTYNKTDSLPFPVAYWYLPSNFVVVDRLSQIIWLAAETESALAIMREKLGNSGGFFLDGSRSTYNTLSNKTNYNNKIEFLTDRSDYEAMVSKAKQYIQAGDIFQTNLSLRFRSIANLDSWQIYQNLQQINPSPFASYWQTPWGAVMSCSPERLVQLQGNIAQTRPIAGTRPRGITPEADLNLEKELLDNRKELAEHIMLVDLERNDLGRVCNWGSVKVDELLTIERYSHVMHLVSNVIGELKLESSSIDLIRAMFPGGTITGCPKVRCMEIIEELEPVRRSLFYGSCGYLDRRGNLDLNILIRTLLYQPQTTGSAIVWGQVGAGIVADSDPEKEWRESLQKAKAQLAALDLLHNS
jgi:para-aminobenzoate synthetase component I